MPGSTISGVMMVASCLSAVIVVTHDQRSLDVFDRTYEMEDGQLLSK